MKKKKTNSKKTKDKSPKSFRSKKTLQRPPSIKNPIQKELKEKGVRLNKYISNAGICSRRKADEHIKAGMVKVNGKVVLEMGYQVQVDDVVEFDNQMVTPEKKVYILLNKPKNVITTTNDPQGRKTVMELLGGAFDGRIYPVGRLDRQTMGLLLLTNDGEIAQKLAHPSSEIPKLYHAVLNKPLTKRHLLQIADGLNLEDGFAPVDVIRYVQGATKKEVGISLHVGRNRIVRRIFEHLGYEVVRLDRVMYAGLTKKDLPRGRWRYLTKKEVVFLVRYKSKRK